MVLFGNERDQPDRQYMYPRVNFQWRIPFESLASIDKRYSARQRSVNSPMACSVRNVSPVYCYSFSRFTCESFTSFFSFFSFFFEKDILSLVKNCRYKMWSLPVDEANVGEEFYLVV